MSLGLFATDPVLVGALVGLAVAGSLGYVIYLALRR